MVSMILSAVELEDDVEHLATDWEISSNASFSDIVLSSIEDYDHLEYITFTETLDANRKWYGRARPLLSTGYALYSNVDVFIPNNNDELAVNDDLPSRVALPQLSTSSDRNNHDLTLFNINASGFEIIGNATHESTTWILEDLDGNAIWHSGYNTIDKNSISVHNIVLKNNQGYRAKAIFHSSSNDSSPIAAYTFRTSEGNDIDLLTYIDYMDVNTDTEVKIAKISGVNSVTWQIISMVNNYAEIIWSTTTTGSDYNISVLPSGLLQGNQYYYLRIQTDLDDPDTWKYIVFRTKGELDTSGDADDSGDDDDTSGGGVTEEPEDTTPKLNITDGNGKSISDGDTITVFEGSSDCYYDVWDYEPGGKQFSYCNGNAYMSETYTKDAECVLNISTNDAIVSYICYSEYLNVEYDDSTGILSIDSSKGKYATDMALTEAVTIIATKNGESARITLNVHILTPVNISNIGAFRLYSVDTSVECDYDNYDTGSAANVFWTDTNNNINELSVYNYTADELYRVLATIYPYDEQYSGIPDELSPYLSIRINDPIASASNASSLLSLMSYNIDSDNLTMSFGNDGSKNFPTDPVNDDQYTYDFKIEKIYNGEVISYMVIPIKFIIHPEGTSIGEVLEEPYLTVSPTSVSITSSSSATCTIDTNGSVSVSSSSSSISASLSGNTITITTTSSTATTGTITVKSTLNGMTVSETIAVTVTEELYLSLSASSVSITSSSSKTVTISTNGSVSVSTTNSAINGSVSGSTLTISTSSYVATSGTITVTSTLNGASLTATVAVTVTATTVTYSITLPAFCVAGYVERKSAKTVTSDAFTYGVAATKTLNVKTSGTKPSCSTSSQNTAIYTATCSALPTVTYQYYNMTLSGTSATVVVYNTLTNNTHTVAVVETVTYN